MLEENKLKVLERLRRNMNLRRDYKKLFRDESGQLRPEAENVLKDLVTFARLFEGVPLEPLPMAATEGSRQVVRRILSYIGTRALSPLEISKLIEGDNYE